MNQYKFKELLGKDIVEPGRYFIFEIFDGKLYEEFGIVEVSYSHDEPDKLIATDDFGKYNIFLPNYIFAGPLKAGDFISKETIEKHKELHMIKEIIE